MRLPRVNLKHVGRKCWDEDDSKPYFCLTVTFVNFYLQMFLPRCDSCKKTTLVSTDKVLDLYCQEEDRFVANPKICIFGRTRIVDSSSMLEAVLDDQLIAQWVGQDKIDQAYNQNQNMDLLSREMKKYLYQEKTVKVQLARYGLALKPLKENPKRLKIYEIFGVNYRQENEKILKRIIS